MTDHSTPISPQPERPERGLDPEIIAALREIATDERADVLSSRPFPPIGLDRLNELDRAVGLAIDERVEHITGGRLRFRIAAHWMGRAAAIAAAVVVGGLVGWQPPAKHAGTETATVVVANDGPISILDAFAVARMLAQHGDRPVDFGMLGLSERVSTRLDLDGDGTIDSSDLERLIERAVRPGGDR